MPKIGKGGTLASRQAILHSLVHIESIAVDLAWVRVQGLAIKNKKTGSVAILGEAFVHMLIGLFRIHV